MRQEEVAKGNQERNYLYPAALLESRSFLIGLVAIYLALGVAWVLFANVLIAHAALYWPNITWWASMVNVLLIVISGGILAVVLWMHAKADYHKEKTLRDSLALQKLSHSIDGEIMADKTAKEVLTAVCAGAVNLGYRLCWAGAVEPGGSIEILASSGIPLEYMTQFQVRWDDSPMGKGPAGRAVRTGEIVIFQDVQANPDYVPWRAVAHKFGFKSVAAIPIIGPDAVLGVFIVFGHKGHAFVKEQLFNLELLAQKASLALFTAGQREALQTLDRRHELILDSVLEGIYGVDLEGRLVFINQAACKMLGHEARDVLGKDIHALVHHTRTDGKPFPTEECSVQRVLKMGEARVTGEEILWRKDGSALPAEFVIAPLKEGENIIGAVVILRDLTELRHFQKRVTNLANYDLVTGVYSRGRFQEELNRAFIQSKYFGTLGALILLDIDGFKAMHSTLGQRVTDELLLEVAKVLGEQLGETDILGNLGGDEFGIILQGVHKNLVLPWAEALLRTLSQRDFFVDGHQLSITASIGVALFSPEIQDGDELLIQGENALYQAKIQGSNQAVVYSGQEQSTLDAPWSWKYRIRRALEKEMFILYYQPIVNLANNELAAYEVLLRLRDEDGELVNPGVFLPWAERYGLIREIDRWVMGQVLDLLGNGSWPEKLVLTVNVSGQTLTDGEFRTMLGEALRNGRIDPKTIIIEITETAAVSGLNEARDFVDDLKRLGPCFALDDFGSGFSSLNYLKHLPVDILKIDGSFIKELPRNPVDQELVKFMVAVAKGLNKRTIAEFVEDRETLELLKEYGIDYAQGYYLGRPGELPFN